MDSEIKSELMIIIILHDISSLLIDSKMETEAKKKKFSNKNATHQDTFRTPFWKLLLLLESFVFCLQMIERAKGYSLHLSGLFGACG